MMNARSDEDYVIDVVNLLWEIALNIEDGNLSVAERELRQIRQELAKALAENAPPSEIAEIMERMRKAMDRYMRELAREMQRRMQEGRLDQNTAAVPARSGHHIARFAKDDGSDRKARQVRCPRRGAKAFV